MGQKVSQFKKRNSKKASQNGHTYPDGENAEVNGNFDKPDPDRFDPLPE